MKKTLAYMAVLIVEASAAFGQAQTWRVKDVETEKVDAPSGKHFAMHVTLVNRGPSFAGRAEESFEVTDSSGARTLYTNSFPCGGIKGFGSVESRHRIFLFVEGMDKPALTAYAIRLTINGIPGVADEKAHKCASMAELIQRNAASRKLPASYSLKSLY